MEISSFMIPVFFIMILYVFIQVSIFFTVFKVIISVIKGIRKTVTNNFFKNNVIVNDNINVFKEKYTDISKKELATFNTDDLDAFKNYFYKIFLQFENAYNNLDYATMRSLSTKQLYNNYHTGISLDLESGKKRIITNIQKKNVIIYEVFSSTAKQVVSALIEVSYINYTTDKQGRVISGDKDKKVIEKFDITFRKDFETKELTNCPNCGAKLNSHKCEFCRSTFENATFKISSIKKIVDNI